MGKLKWIIQLGLEYQTQEYQTQWNTKNFAALFSNDPKTRWPPF